LRTIIFANGDLDDTDRTAIHGEPAGLVIAADGGARHCLELEITPDLVIGDFDSLSEAEIEQLTAREVPFERHPVAKDETDLELAFQAAVSRGADEIRVYGALGSRWDMSLANLLLLAHTEFRNARIELVAGNQHVWLVRPTRALILKGEPGDIVSLVPLRGNAIGIATDNLEYQLHDEDLKFGATRGISNVMLADRARVTLRQGELLCIHTRLSLALNGTKEG
jgi:thiamine pyrophosphokinase